MNPISVLYFTSDASSYGANSSLVNLLQSLKNINGNHISVNYYVIIPNKGPIEDRFKDLGIPYFVVHYREDSSFWNKSLYSYLSYIPKYFYKCIIEYFAIKKLQHVVIEKKIQIIHSNSSVIGIGLRLAKRCKTKHVWHLREFQNLDFGMRPYRGWNYLFKEINKSDAVISISKSIAQHFKVINNSYIFFNAVSSEKKILSSCKKDKYFLFCGSFSPNKGVHIAIKAFTEFNKKHPGFKLYIAGSSISAYKSYEIELKKMVSDVNLNNSIFFLGYRKDTRQLMNKAQALLMCSKSEGMGRVTAEAMLSDCIVIGYNNAGTKEMIMHGINGLLFKTDLELVNHMSDIINSRIDTDMIRKNALIYAKENFLEETYGEKLLEVYKSIVI